MPYSTREDEKFEEMVIFHSPEHSRVILYLLPTRAEESDMQIHLRQLHQVLHEIQQKFLSRLVLPRTPRLQASQLVSRAQPMF